MTNTFKAAKAREKEKSNLKPVGVGWRVVRWV